MDAKLAQLQSISQKDKAAGYLSLLSEALAQPDAGAVARDVHAVLEAALTQDHVGIVVGRQVLAELVSGLAGGAARDRDLKKRIVEDALAIAAPRGVSFEEQVNSLRFQLADLLEEEEDWSGSAHILTGIQLEHAQDEEKLKVYIRIVRLLLEEEDSVQAETYYKRAALLVNAKTDRETSLNFKLCQARINDYTRKFLEAASRYHELSWAGEVDEEERSIMLSSAVTCAVLAPAGPNRSRVLASLCRDERTTQLPSYNILSKMFLDRILRLAEVKEFEATLKSHQLARIAQSSNDRLAASASSDADDGAAETGAGAGEAVSTRTGPSTVLDRAVLEHNLLASSKIYNNITFYGLGALLDLTPGAAETMARRMIEQGRLKGSIDQVERLIWFEDSKEEDDAQGKAGGLGEVDMHTEDTGAPHTKKWDMQIRMTAANVESIVQHLADKNLVTFAAAS
ncbi:hypothetical protein DFH11DRAFT_1567955 [Phellopilus nigrolimitatus]|nr:hypothetical protein DFH11DRAFT_1567955 [Phellopilus nigrolimitatus]